MRTSDPKRYGDLILGRVTQSLKSREEYVTLFLINNKPSSPPRLGYEIQKSFRGAARFSQELTRQVMRLVQEKRMQAAQNQLIAKRSRIEVFEAHNAALCIF